jgi:hypothetical protein
MSVNYSITAINDRLAGVVTAIGQAGNGFLKLQSAAAVTLSSIQLNNPCGTVNGGVLTFTGSLIDPSADATGTATQAVITDTNGNVMISGLTVGIPLSGADIVLTNGLNSTLITVGQVVQLLGAQITGS